MRRTLISMVCVAAMGCANASAQEAISAQPLPQMPIHCGRTAPSPMARWIADPVQWQDAYAETRATVFESLDPPPVDFAKFGVLFLEMGERRTGGYTLALASEQAPVKDGVARVTVRWDEPPRGAIVPQVITSPCLMVQLQKGEYERIEVVDQNGRTRAEVRVP